ncbi:hypothetical protein [Legionella bononiensis]|uniref:hypothetical protein n=1 Tax=Legionella bononiensis TaxID=2793102 RepID=UPI001EE44115|nr:hypothetical protein [Legionella bononiensis]
MWQENEYNTTLMEILPFIQDNALEFGKTTVIPSERRDLLNVAGKRLTLYPILIIDVWPPEH